MIEEHKQQIKDFLEEKWKGPPLCPVCKANNWAITEKIMEISELKNRDQGNVSWQVKPVIVLDCLECGHILLFNAGFFKEPLLRQVKEG